jgi:eukaryotic-like serine/threonine-protein kinase
LNPVPERIGKYSILRELGQGATARVLLGRDAFADRMVAVKLFHGGIEGGELTGMDRVAFLNEAKLVGKLNHPHIVALLDAAVEPDHAYIVKEFVPGGTLAQHSAAELLPVQKVIEVAFKIAALEYAYSHGVIHCDIKPSNVLVTDTLDVKLSDFGIAIVKDATHTHLMNAGTPAYVAPEQLSNDPPTQQSDIYSLGVLIYQLLTGRLPFSASSHASLMYQILNHAPPAPRELRRDLPEALEAIVLRAMQKDPGARYGSWFDFGHDRAAARQVIGGSQVPGPAWLVVLRWLQRRRDLGDAANRALAQPPGGYSDHRRRRAKRKLLPPGRRRGRCHPHRSPTGHARAGRLFRRHALLLFRKNPTDDGDPSALCRAGR